MVTSQCGFDLNDCSSDNLGSCDRSSRCGETYHLFKFVANYHANDNPIEQMKIDKWWDVGVAFGIFDDFEGVNKLMAIPLTDLDDDCSLSLQETFVALHKYFAILSEKAR